MPGQYQPSGGPAAATALLGGVDLPREPGFPSRRMWFLCPWIERGPVWVLASHHLTASSVLPTKWLFVSLQTAEETGAQRGDITCPRSEGNLGLEAVRLAESLGGLPSLLCATSWACPSYMTLSTSVSYSETQSPHVYTGFDGSILLLGLLSCVLLLSGAVIGFSGG